MDLQERLNKAWELKKSGDHMTALRFYHEVFNELGGEAAAYARMQPGTLTETIEGGEKVRTIQPEYLEKAKHYLRRDKIACTISNNMAVIFAELGDIASARKLFEQAIELTPEGFDYPDPRIALEELGK